VIIRSQNNEAIDGALQALTIGDRYDQVTFVTDGVEWVVWSYRR